MGSESISCFSNSSKYQFGPSKAVHIFFHRCVTMSSSSNSQFKPFTGYGNRLGQSDEHKKVIDLDADMDQACVDEAAKAGFFSS
jgi:hypothetical protein